MRFAAVPVGQYFIMYFGSRKTRFKKLSETTAITEKLNSPGMLTITLNPALNEDECTITE